MDTKNNAVNETLIGRYRDWIAIDLNLARSTVAEYTSECNRFIAYLAQYDLLLSAATASDITRYLVMRQTEGSRIGHRTLVKLLSILRSLFHFLSLEGKIENEPTETIETPRIQINPPAALSIDQVTRLLDAIPLKTPQDIRDRALFEVIYSSGLRISEACNIRLEDLSISQRVIRIKGKRDKERLSLIGEEAVYWINRYLTEARARLANRERRVSHLFLNRFGNGISRKGVWKRFQALCARAGLQTKVHTLRHSFATHLLRNGSGLRVVQELLGHSNISTTQLYTHVDRDDLRDYHSKYHPRSKNNYH